MQNIVDVVSVEGVIKFISANGKLNKFIIFRQNARSGSTPVFDCSHTNTNHAACSSFKSWAENILQANPMNNMSYDMLLFKDKEDGELDDDNKQQRNTANKSSKVRFSFCLTQFSNYMPHNNFNQQPQVNIADEIARALEVHELKRRVKELEEDDGDDDDDGNDALDKTLELVREINKHDAIKKGKVVTLAADDDDLGDDDLGDDTKTKNMPDKKNTAVKMERIKKALRSLNKHTDDLDGMLINLAKFANQKPVLFKQYMQTLKTMVD